MPESEKVQVTVRAIEPRGPEMVMLTRVEQKLDALARAIGGPSLKGRWDSIEEQFGIGVRRRTFKRRRCGCFVGSPHGEACPKAT